MNKKEEQDRAIKYIKIRVTERERDTFRKYCENLNIDMTKALKIYIESCIKTISKN